MEFCDKGDLENYISRMGKDNYIPEAKVWKFFIQILEGLKYLHQKNVIHGDLKPQNLFVTGKDYDIRIGDFGISTSLGFEEGLAYEAVGSLAYCSPELLNEEPYNQKADIWAVGCILYELINKT